MNNPPSAPPIRAAANATAGCSDMVFAVIRGLRM